MTTIPEARLRGCSQRLATTGYNRLQPPRLPAPEGLVRSGVGTIALVVEDAVIGESLQSVAVLRRLSAS